jgi:hypothetical protein
MGILSYLEEAATGGMKELIRDIGIHPDNLSFVNVGDLQKQRDAAMTGPGDISYNYIMNALFTPVDMTDYEDSFVGIDEVQGELP